jgi:hypothetical protein
LKGFAIDTDIWKTESNRSNKKWRQKVNHSWSGCQIFVDGKIPNDHYVFNRYIHISNGHKIYQMGVKYIDQMDIKISDIFHCKTLQNLPKLVEGKYTIWQPCESWSQNADLENSDQFSNVSVCWVALLL